MGIKKSGHHGSLFLSTGLSVVVAIACAPMSDAQTIDPQSTGTSSIRNSAQANLTPSLSPQQPSTLTSATTYVLGPGDALDIAVIGYPEFVSTQTVLPDGSVSLPLIGAVQASGKTIESLSRDIEEGLRSYLVNPVVNLSLQSMRPVWVTVGGAVTRPGPIQLNAGDTEEESQGIPTLATALAAVGGVTRNADISQVRVQRRLSDGTSETTTLDLWASLGESSTPIALLLRDGDVITVPERSLDNETVNPNLVARSTFAPTAVRVRVVGEVTDPGEVEVTPYSSLSSAIAVAGGPTPDAKLREVGFVRMNDRGEVTTETIDLRGLDDIHQVQDGDVIIVPRTGLATALDFFGQIFAPVSSVFRLF